MRNQRITLKEGVRFHGHLGPYLVLGMRAGELALKKLKCKKYFGVNVKVWGADKKPKSCLIDGLQLSTGATYGKGNISKMDGDQIRILVIHSRSRKRVRIFLKSDLTKKLSELKDHWDSEVFARKLYNRDPVELFRFQF